MNAKFSLAPEGSSLVKGRTSKIFGVKLEYVVPRSAHDEVPIIFKELILRLQHLVNQGAGLAYGKLFFKSPLWDDIQRSKAKIDTEESAKDVIESMDIHLVVSLLKLYLTELPGSVLTTELYQPFIDNMENVEYLRKLVQTKLPRCHRMLAKVLIVFFLGMEREFGEYRLMVDDLANVFGRIILRPPPEIAETLRSCMHRAILFKTLLYNFEQIFEPERGSYCSLVEVACHSELNRQRQLVDCIYRKVEKSLRDDKEVLSGYANAGRTITAEEIGQLRDRQIADMADLNAFFDQVERRALLPTLMQVSKYVPCCVSRTLVESGSALLQGARPTIEDYYCLFDDLNAAFGILTTHVNRSFYALYDGHAGPHAAETASRTIVRAITEDAEFCTQQPEKVLRKALIRCDQEIIEHCNECNGCSGTTAAICMIEGETIYVANLGDSEVVLAHRTSKHWDHREDSSAGSSHLMATVLSERHTPCEYREAKRLSDLGSIVLKGRIFGKLAVSRALGDAEYKIPRVKVNYVSNEPYIRSLPLDRTHEFLIIASDGLWDKIPYQQAVDFVYERLFMQQSVPDACRKLAQHAYDLGSQDNISVIIVKLNWKLVN